MRLVFSFALLLVAPLVVSAAQQAQPAPPPDPLLAEWTTPFGVPPFDQIKDEHFLPAYQAAIARQRAEVEAIASSREKPTSPTLSRPSTERESCWTAWRPSSQTSTPPTRTKDGRRSPSRSPP